MPNKPSAWRDVRLVARREIEARLRQKGFVIGSLIGIAVVLIGSVLPGVLGGDSTPHYNVAVTGPDAAALKTTITDVAQAFPVAVRVDVRTAASQAGARAAVRDHQVDAAVLDGRVVVNKSLPSRLAAVLDGALRINAVDQAVNRGDLRRSAAQQLTTAGLTHIDELKPTTSASERRKTLTFIGTFLLYGQILTYGIWVAVGLVEEKASRVIEVLLSTIRPRRLLNGKIIGIGLLGIGQLLAMAVVGLAGASIAGSMSLPPGWPLTVGTVVLWFTLGFAFYACGFAVAGSLVSRQEEMQGVQFPLTILVVVAFFAATVTVRDPAGVVAVACTFIPPTAPFVVPLRMAAGTCPWWQAGAAFAITLLACAAMVLLAARIYAGAALRTRGRTKLRAAWRGTD
jgi:ABC-2 type transport system permease protein